MKKTMIRHLVAALVLGTGAEVLHAQQFTMSKAEGAAVALGDGRIAIFKADGQRAVVSSIVESGTMTEPRANIQTGDVATRILSIANPTVQQLDATFNALKQGDEVVIGLKRGTAAEHEIRFKRPAGGATMAISMNAAGASAGTGAWTTGAGGAATELVIAGAHIRENNEGMPEVTHRTADAAASAVALKTGDVVIRANGRNIVALLGLQKIYGDMKAGSEVAFIVQRAGAEVEVKFTKPAN